MNKEKLEKEMFEMVYNWGKVGLKTDEKCNAFQSILKKYRLCDKVEDFKEMPQFKGTMKQLDNLVNSISSLKKNI